MRKRSRSTKESHQQSKAAIFSEKKAEIARKRFEEILRDILSATGHLHEGGSPGEQIWLVDRFYTIS